MLSVFTLPKTKTLMSFLFALILSLMFIGCDDTTTVENETELSAKVAVFSDPHYFSPSLCDTASPDFKTYLAQDRKLIAESDAILASIVSELVSSDVDIVLVPGDLTKDGAAQCHNDFASYMKQLKDAGKKVLVVPGNHDVNNDEATSYASGSAEKVSSVSSSDFTTIYGDYGYNSAIAKDANSLSYVSEPVNGLWVIGMDACQYDNNHGHSITAGQFKDETLNWIYGKIEEGISKGKVVWGMMHHGIIEHYGLQKTLFTEYVVNNWEEVSTKFAEKGMTLVFTGHYHANDIVKKEAGDKFLFDIETGSTVTYPCPYRILELKDDKTVKVETKYVTSVNYDTKGETFPNYALSFLQNGLSVVVKYMLMADYQLSEPEAEALAPLMTAAMMAHYAGDEDAQLTPEIQGAITQMQQSGDQNQVLMGTALNNLYNDPAPADNNIIIDLNTGEAL